MKSQVVGNTSFVKREKEKRNFINIIGYLVSTILFISASIYYIYPQVKMVKIMYLVETGKKSKRVLLKRRKELKIEIATLKEPNRIQEIAKSKFGFIFPERGQVVIVKKDIKKNRFNRVYYETKHYHK